MIIIESDSIRAKIAVDQGATVVSLLDLHSGREWLERGADARPVTAFGAAADAMVGGWDECFPSIAPGRHPDAEWEHVELADHGELWTRPWKVVRRDTGLLETTIDGVRLPYSFTRKINVSRASLDVEYQVVNTGDLPYAAMWSMHPVFAGDESCRVLIPGVESAMCEFTTDAEVARLGALVNFDRLPRGRPYALKLHTARGAARTAVISDPRDDSWIAIAFDVPYLGLWLNRRGWPVGGTPADHVALEPTTAGSDDLARASKSQDDLLLQPATPKRWRVRLMVGTGFAAAKQALASELEPGSSSI